MTSDTESRLNIGAAAVILASFVVSFAALLVARDGPSAAGPSAPSVVSIVLTEFAIAPASIEIPAAVPAELRIANNGNIAHTFEIPDLKLSTGNIGAGESTVLRLPARDPGSIKVLCNGPGHAPSGMTGVINVAASAGKGAPASSVAPGAMAGMGTGMGEMTADQMDAAMAARAKIFPAATAGHGGEPLAPVIAADGTKEFDLTASVVDWEVEPGKTVKAWTYNGVVPGPEIKVAVGDRVRIVLKNQLPESTALHVHGIRVPNALDGVPPYTQDPIKPGSSFTYEFTAQQAGVGMYHSHHDAQVQVPNGLAGALIIGEQTIPPVLGEKGFSRIDRTVNMVLDDAGTIGLALNGKSFPATEPYKMKVGEVMLVNYFNEGLQIHPMHLHQPTGWVIAKDGVPLLVPMPSDTVLIGPGERYTVLYKAIDPGVWAWHCHILNHAEGPQGMFGMVTALIVEP
jgi:FtsP/CotA-like multicopper oxidase with cupredoxin domain